jgi:hypothetical protein
VACNIDRAATSSWKIHHGFTTEGHPYGTFDGRCPSGSTTRGRRDASSNSSPIASVGTCASGIAGNSSKRRRWAWQ